MSGTGQDREIAVVTRPTRAQVARLIRHQVLSSVSRRMMVLGGLVGAPILYAFALLSPGAGPPRGPYIMVWILGLAIAIIFLLGLPAWTLRSTAMKDFLDYGVRYRFSEHSVFARAAKSNSEMQWSLFTKAVRLRHFYALRLAEGASWLMVPRSAFSSPQEENDFVTLVRVKPGKDSRL